MKFLISFSILLILNSCVTNVEANRNNLNVLKLEARKVYEDTPSLIKEYNKSSFIEVYFPNSVFPDYDITYPLYANVIIRDINSGKEIKRCTLKKVSKNSKYAKTSIIKRGWSLKEVNHQYRNKIFKAPIDES